MERILFWAISGCIPLFIICPFTHVPWIIWVTFSFMGLMMGSLCLAASDAGTMGYEKK